MAVNQTILNEFQLTCQRPISEMDKTFEDRSRSILASVSSLLGNDIRTEGIWKICIKVNSANPIQHMKVVGGVYYYNVAFDVDKFLNESIPKQRQKMVQFISTLLTEVFQKLGLENGKFAHLEQYVTEREFKNVFSGPRSNHNGLTAQIVCDQYFDRATVSLSIRKGRKEIERYSFDATSPDEFAFGIYLKAPEWLSDAELKLVAANEQIYSIIRTK